MANISFSRVIVPTGSWSPSQNPQQIGGEEDFLQPYLISDGGVVYCYDKGEEKIMPLMWPKLEVSEFSSLRIFFQAMKARRYTFTLTDIDASTKTARFWSGLSWQYNDTGLTVKVSFNLRLE